MPDKKNILILAEYQSLYGGNFIASLCCLEKKLTEGGNGVYYAFPEGIKERDWFRKFQKGRNIVFVREKTTAALADKLAEWTDSFHIDILYVHFGYMAAARLAGLKRKKLCIVLHQHSDFSAGKKLSAKQTVRRCAVRTMETLLGKRLRQIYVGTSVATGKNGVIIGNAVAEQRFTDDLRNREEERKILNLKEEDKLVILFGWSPEIKGADIAADAVRMLREQDGGNIFLGIVGGRDYPEDRLRKWIGEHSGCSGTEKWLLYLEPTEDVFRYHKASDLMLSASRSEGFPYSVLEALYLGKPCVVSHIPGTAWAEKYPTVCSFENGNAENCSCAIKESLEKDSQKDIKEVSSQVQKEYNIQSWVAEVSEVLYGNMPVK